MPAFQANRRLEWERYNTNTRNTQKSDLVAPNLHTKIINELNDVCYLIILALSWMLIRWPGLNSSSVAAVAHNGCLAAGSQSKPNSIFGKFNWRWCGVHEHWAHTNNRRILHILIYSSVGNILFVSIIWIICGGIYVGFTVALTPTRGVRPDFFFYSVFRFLFPSCHGTCLFPINMRFLWY